MATNTDTYGIKGIVRPEDAKYYTRGNNEIPYATGLPQRREITEWFEDMENPRSTSDKALLQKQWTLFVLGLELFKAMPVDEKLSYFQIAGIHGYPETAWDGAPSPKKDPTGDPYKRHPGEQPFGGYCHHNTVAFPTWHRPYMLLYEQCIWDNMQIVIRERNLEPREEWEHASSTWRLPYWDWGMRQKYPSDTDDHWDDFGLSYLFIFDQVPIYINGRELHANPLIRFVNPEVDPSTGLPLAMGNMPEPKKQYNIKDNVPFDPKEETLPWSQCSGTSRYGVLLNDDGLSYKGLEGVNDYVKANIGLASMGFSQSNNKNEVPKFAPRWYKPGSAMSDDQWKLWKPGNLADSVNRMFSPEYNGSWSTFSSTKWFREWQTDVRTGYLSLEYIHNNVHNITGGYTAKPDKNRPTGDIYGLGHMCDVPVAAFDPIFWLHHCNIDRYTAMWQALNWDKWFDGEEDPNKPIPPPKEGYDGWPGPLPDIKPDEPLVPFHTAPPAKGPYWTSNMARDWTQLGYVYDDMQDLTELEGCVDMIDGVPTLNQEVYRTVLQAYIHQAYPGTSYEAWKIRANPKIDNALFFGKVDENKAWFEDYVINVVYDRYALEGSSYSIRFYLGGEANDAASALADEGNFIGQVYSLGGMRLGGESGEAGCVNCTMQNDLRTLSRGQVALTISIMQLAADPSYDGINAVKTKEAIKYIEEHLHFKFVQAGSGNVRPVTDFPDTKVSIWGGVGVAQKKQYGGETQWLPPVYDTQSYSEYLTADKGNAWKLTPPKAEWKLFSDTGLLEEIGSGVAERLAQGVAA